jgi:coenzyme F420-reducing hydrogenase delta subunit
MSMTRDARSRGFEPDIAVLYCRRSAASNAELTTGTQQGKACRARLVMMPCSSKVQVPYMMRILERGADGIVLVGCPEDRCQFQTGSRMAAKRIARARSLLEEIGFGAERAAMEHGQELGQGDLVAIADRRAEAIRELGPSPMKEERPG